MSQGKSLAVKLEKVKGKRKEADAVRISLWLPSLFFKGSFILLFNWLAKVNHQH